jgi:EAL domain-containing protein (putative c-di-GMP-specific phosphodiesterase class I)
MHRLRALGVQLSIDDLGTGYSSLSYLQRLPVTEVKIDRSFLRPGAGDDDGDGGDGDEGGGFAIVGAVVDLGHRLGRHVVAEGVEDEQTWQRLQRLGCDAAQGYWMSRPLAADDFTGWLSTWRPPVVASLRVMA